MLILGIDTSCDDTCVALVEAKNSKFRILSNIVSSQVELHAKYGGVYPALAKREHQRNLPTVLNKALRRAGFVNPKSEIRNPKQIPNPKFKIPNIDLIGVTVGPGLEPCLWQGVNFARELAKKLKKPLVPVNHIEAHILANFICRGLTSIEFPAIALVVSGGHTQLILMKTIGEYKLIGETRDDAAGECFDKVARILGLGYPGGPAIAKTASKYKIQNTKYKISLPRPMMKQKNYDFSFSGLKTAVLYKVKSLPRRQAGGKYHKAAMAAEVQQAIIDVLAYKTIKAARGFRVKSIILGGGVVANDELRKQFKKKFDTVVMPPQNLCTDNAAMIAVTVFFHRSNAKKDIKADANLRI